MKLSFIFLLLFLQFASFVSAQLSPEYTRLISEAENLYRQQDFLQAARSYTHAFASQRNRGLSKDRYRAACAWAQTAKKDSAFTELFRLASQPHFTQSKLLLSETALQSLHSDERWQALLTIVQDNHEQSQALLDQNLLAQLDRLSKEDMDIRAQLVLTENKFGRESPEMKAMWRAVEQKDSLHLLTVSDILDKRGWLGPEVIGEEGSRTLFLVIQHADLGRQQRYLPLLRKAVAQGKAPCSNLALLEDRVALREGKQQRYGTQVGWNAEQNRYYVLPLSDPANVDKRRAEVGLGPLQEYVANWGITWDAGSYEKSLPNRRK